MLIVVAVRESKAMDNTAKKALEVQAEVRAHLEASNAKYKAKANNHLHKKVLAKDDLVMANMRQSRFLDIRTKLEKHKYGLFCLVRKISDN